MFFRSLLTKTIPTTTTATSRCFLHRTTRYLTTQQQQQQQESNIQVDIDENKKIAIVSLCRKPVNSLNLEFLQELTTTIKNLEQKRSSSVSSSSSSSGQVEDGLIHGMVLKSGLKNIFSAGLDIREMYRPTQPRLSSFWTALQELWITLYSTPLATAAAIQGEAPAGGCLLAMCCDFRVMAEEGSHRIGLNETQLGIVAPTWFKDTMVNTVGFRSAERMLQIGEMVDAQNALKLGLVDIVVPKDDVVDVAKKELAERWLKLPFEARSKTKLVMRSATVQSLVRQRDEDLQQFCSFTMSNSVQSSLESYLARLSKKKS